MNPQKEILEYIKTQRVGVLAVEMMDGAPHGATVHFAHSVDPFIFYFETNKNYRKSEALFGRKESRASFVIGTDEKATKTFQMDGIVSLVKPGNMAKFKSIYLEKFAEKMDKSKDPAFVAFTFTPTWWRFTDWNGPEGKKITTSDE